MKCYIVAFETESEKSLKEIESSLRAYGIFCPINSSCWAIKTDESATQIREKLLKSLDKDGRIFVIRSGTEAAWFNSYGGKHNKWLKEHL